LEARLVDSDQLAPAEVAAARRESRVIRSINSNLRDRSEPSDSTERIAFFCECQNPGCYMPLWMSVAAFDAMVAVEAGWLVLEGHDPSELWHRREPLPTRESARSRRPRLAVGLETPDPAGGSTGAERVRRLSVFLSARQGASSRPRSIKP
jgi:hypothetical protein